MTKVGLKDTLALLAKGYTKKEIDALAAIDEEQEAPATGAAQPEAPAPAQDKKDPEDAAAKESTPDPDLKKELETKQKELEEIQKKLKENEDKLKKIQQDNTHKNSAPEADEAKKKEAESLTNLVRSFM